MFCYKDKLFLGDLQINTANNEKKNVIPAPNHGEEP